MNIIEEFAQEIQRYDRPIKIIFPEGDHTLIKEAVTRLIDLNIKPILVYRTEEEAACHLLPAGVQKLAITNFDTKTLGDQLYELRKNKLTLEQAHKLILEPNYFSVMMVKAGHADGMVGGIAYTSKDIIIPTLQIIKARPGLKFVSSVILLMNGDTKYIFTDCALMIYPTSPELAQIAKLGYEAAEMFRINNPNLAFLSYSSAGSGRGPHVDIVKKAVQELRDENWNKCAFDGELQFDSASDIKVRAKKAPNSTLLEEPANIYVFPNLDAGNNAYKIAQSWGQFDVAGPLIMGLDKPVNDLSRGASANDIFRTAVTTAYNYLMNSKSE